MAENADEVADDIPQIKVARVQKVPPFLLVKHVPTPSENDTPGEEKKKVFNCKCSVCEKSFTTIFNLHRHLRRVHKLMVLKLRTGEFICDVCKRSYTSKKYLSSHFSMKHRPKEQRQKPAITCPECNHTFRTRDLLRNHIADTHGVVIEPKEFTFSCKDEFNTWKAELEKEDGTKYARFCGNKNISITKWKEYHVCHRSGFFKRRENATRRLKQNGSCKIGGTCPATIIVTVSSETKELQVTLWGQHFGHGPDAPMVKNGPYKRIRNKVVKKKSDNKLEPKEKKNSDSKKLGPKGMDFLAVNLKNKTIKQYRRKRKNPENDLNTQGPLLLDNMDNNVAVIIPTSSEDNADNFVGNSAVFVHPLCFISSGDMNGAQIMEVETEVLVPIVIDVAKETCKNIPTKTQRKYTVRKRTRNTNMDTAVVSSEPPVLSITTYCSDNDATEVSRSMLLDESPAVVSSEPPTLSVTTYCTDNKVTEVSRSMLLDESPATLLNESSAIVSSESSAVVSSEPPTLSVTAYGSDNEATEVSRSMLLNQSSAIVSSEPPAVVSSEPSTLSVTAYGSDNEATEVSRSILLDESPAMLLDESSAIVSSESSAVVSSEPPTLSVTAYGSDNEATEVSTSMLLDESPAVVSSASSAIVSSEPPTLSVTAYDSDNDDTEVSRSMLLDESPAVVSSEPPTLSVTAYDSDNDDTEVGRSMLLNQSSAIVSSEPPTLSVTAYCSDNDDTEVRRSMLLDESSASPVTTYYEDEPAEVSRSLLLDQINQLRHIVLNKNITDREQSITLKKLNDCIQMLQDN